MEHYKFKKLLARWAHIRQLADVGYPSTRDPRYQIKARRCSSGFFYSAYSNMFIVYALYSKKYQKIYIGMTSDLERRLFAHNNLPKGWTAKFRPCTVIHTKRI